MKKTIIASILAASFVAPSFASVDHAVANAATDKVIAEQMQGIQDAQEQRTTVSAMEAMSAGAMAATPTTLPYIEEEAYVEYTGTDVAVVGGFGALTGAIIMAALSSSDSGSSEDAPEWEMPELPDFELPQRPVDPGIGNPLLPALPPVDGIDPTDPEGDKGWGNPEKPSDEIAPIPHMPQIDMPDPDMPVQGGHTFYIVDGKLLVVDANDAYVTTATLTSNGGGSVTIEGKEGNTTDVQVTPLGHDRVDGFKVETENGGTYFVKKNEDGKLVPVPVPASIENAKEKLKSIDKSKLQNIKAKIKARLVK